MSWKRIGDAPDAIDADTADRILAGHVGPDDAPPGMEGVTGLVQAARTAPSAAEVAGSVAGAGAGGASVGSRRLAGKAVGAGMVAALTLGVVGVAAAATLTHSWTRGAETTAVVRDVSSTASTASTTPSEGDDVEGTEPETTDATEPTEPTESTETTVPASTTVPAPAPVGPDAAGEAHHGLCTAFGSRSSMPGQSVAAANLQAAADAAGQSIEEFCADVTKGDGHAGDAPGRTPDVTTPSSTDPHPSAGDHPSADTHPSVPAAPADGHVRSQGPPTSVPPVSLPGHAHSGGPSD